MPKRTRRTQTPRQPIPAVATAARFDGEAVKIELVMQPQDAAHLADQIVNALVAQKNDR